MLQEYQKACATPSDINEHLPTLWNYANQCTTVVELGTRTGVSTWAWLASSTKFIHCFDLVQCMQHLQNHALVAITLHKHFYFHIQDSLTPDFLVPPCDLLFIDTLHTYEQLEAELEQHHNRVRKYIIMHDTEKFAHKSHHGRPDKGLQNAIAEFLTSYSDWFQLAHYPNNNGLTILQRR